MTNQVDYFEIGSADPTASRTFYAELFGWTIGPSVGPANYATINQGQGGLWDTTGMGGGGWTIFYVNVDDVQATIDQAVQSGATVAVPAVDNGVITFAHLIDPQGNRFGIWRPHT